VDGIENINDRKMKEKVKDGRRGERSALLNTIEKWI
jgi:hypothetical protein